MDTLIQTVAVYALPVLFAITLHEAAHGYIAYLFGDRTAYMLGRVSVNPSRHIDPMGTIVMPLILYFLTSGAFLFGFAKPVPVNFGQLRNPRWHGLLVTLAGPGCNFIQALIWAIVSVALGASGVTEPFFVQMANAGIMVNLVMCIFNLFPLPPLDGGRIVVALLPPKQGYAFSRIEPYGFYIVMALVLTKLLTRYWLSPLMDVFFGVIRFLLMPLLLLLR
ncbi:site-2 protease family protein [Robbsia sp. KACC 23696]|uniref:site-2 protease family protein n=1 Tax=Robbsia sp. KACC 23696 TaxID=3149231 RepID=UPI00325AAB49